jgi:hypothetical protein
MTMHRDRDRDCGRDRDRDRDRGVWVIRCMKRYKAKSGPRRGARGEIASARSLALP